MPDFDIDFCQDRRDEVIRYVQERYGRDQVAQIITFGTLQARGVLRDVGRVLQMPYGQVDKLCKLVPQNPAQPGHARSRDRRRAAAAGRARQRSGRQARLRHRAEARRPAPPRLDPRRRHRDRRAAARRNGAALPRSEIGHAGDPVQHEMGRAGRAGEVRLPRPQDAHGAARPRWRCCAARGIEIDLSAIPLDDAKTYALLARAEAVGIFQLESQGMRRALLDMRPDRFEDIIALVALYRPGPMANIPTYCARKHGTGAAGIHPSQARAGPARDLRRHRLSGTGDAGRADARRLFARRGRPAAARHGQEDPQRDGRSSASRFVTGAVERGIEHGQAEAIFDLLERFADYGFNKSHAAAYALVAYQTAYMKANYPVEFLAASMTLDMGNTDKLSEFRAEAERLGIKVEPPSINRSGVAFEVEGNTIHYALAALKGVGAPGGRSDRRGARRAAVRAICPISRAASIRAPSTSACWKASRPAGAFDALESNRARVFAAVDAMLAVAQREHEAAASGAAANSFGGPAAQRADPAARRRAWLPAERLQQGIRRHRLLPHRPSARRLCRRAQAHAGAVLGRVRTRGASGRDRRPRRRAPWWRAPSGAPAPAARWASSGFPIRSGHYEAVLFSEGLAAVPRPAGAGRRGAAVAVGRGAGRRRARPHPDRSSRSIRRPPSCPRGCACSCATQRRSRASPSGSKARPRRRRTTARSRWC